MAHTPLAALLHYLRSLHNAAGVQRSDRELLQQYVAHRDEAAFAALLHRHAPLAWSVCRRLLDNEQDAEDAFQAVFLVLLRKSTSLQVGASLAGWLHAVATRIALKSRVTSLRRLQRERRAVMPESSDPYAAVEERDLRVLLDEELDRLPEKYRAPLVLCYLEGLSYTEAARQLGWRDGTLCGRLARAREMLRQRLGRRGLTLSGAALTAALTESVAAPATMVAATARMAALFTLGQAAGSRAVSNSVATLAQGVLQAMTVAKVKTVVAVIAVFCVLAFGGGLTAHWFWTAKELPPERTETPLVKNAAQPRKEPPARIDRYGDPLPAGAVARLGTRRLCGSMHPMWLQFSPDGSKIASQGLFGVMVWDTVSGKRLVERKDYNALANGMAWRKDGTGVAIIRLPNHSYFVSEFTNANEKVPNPLPTPPPNAIPVPGPDGGEWLALSPDAARLAIVRNYEKEKITVELFTVVTGRLVSELKRERTLGPFDGPCREVRYSATGQLIVLSGPIEKKGDWSLTVVDADRNRVLRTCRIPPPGFCPWKYMLSFSPDARLAAIPPTRTDGPNNHTGVIRVWDLEASKEVRSLPFEERGYGTGHALTPDGKHLITSNSKNYFQIWDLATGKEVMRSGEQYSTEWGMASAVTVSADGKRFATGRQGDGKIDIWDTQNGKPTIAFAAHRDTINAVAVSPDNQLAATLGSDSFLRTWELATGQAKQAVPAPSQDRAVEHSGAKPRLRFTPDGRGLLFRAANILTLIDPHTGNPLALPAALRNRREYLGDFSADRRTLATFTADKVMLWDWPAASVRVTFNVPLNPHKPDGIGKGPERVVVNSVDLSPDGRLLFTNSSRRWDGPRGGGYQNSNDVWDGRSGKHLYRLTKPETEHPPGVFSPDGQVLYLGGHSLDGRGRRLADALTAWDPTAGTLLRCFEEPQREADTRFKERFGRMVATLAVSPDGRLLTVAETPFTAGNVIWLYETASGRILKQLPGHVRQVTDLTFTPDGRRLVSVSEDHTGLVWDVTVPGLGDAAAVRLAQAWERLAEFDPKPGYNAMAALTASPTDAVALLRDKLRPAPVPTDADLDRLVGQLDADTFTERQKAFAELERFGPNAVAGVKVRLKQSPPLEVRKRLLLFLEQYDGPNPHQLRCVRAVAALEAMNTVEARTLLAELAKGPPNDVLTREAQAASRRAGR